MKFTGKYAHRTISGGVGHDMPQEAPQAFAEAVVPRLPFAVLEGLFAGQHRDRVGARAPARQRAAKAFNEVLCLTEIRSFLTTQREQVLVAIPPAEKVRLGTRLLQGWVSDADIDAFEILYRVSDTTARQGLRAAVVNASVTLAVQRARLQKIVGS